MTTSLGEGLSQLVAGSPRVTLFPLLSIHPTLSADTVGRSISGELAIIL